MARSTARKRALNTLYEADEKSQDILSLLDERIAHPGAQTPLPDYAIEIVKGVAEHRRQIDMTLDEHSTGWKVRRMGVVDRNILRIAAWEILFTDDVPDKVAIDEALALAKTLCDDDSPAFIHGLLSAVCSAKNAAPSPVSVAEEADEESSDSAAAASEPTDEGDVSDSPDSSGASDEPAAPSADRSAFRPAGFQVHARRRAEDGDRMERLSDPAGRRSGRPSLFMGDAGHGARGRAL